MSNQPSQNSPKDSPFDKTQLRGRDIAIDYLRSFVIVNEMNFNGRIFLSSKVTCP